MLAGYLAGLPAFVIYFSAGLAIMAVFAVLYVQITAHSEFALIREGNVAAVPAFLGAMVGFAMPLTAAMRFSVNVLDFVIWAVIAAAVQIAAYFLGRAMMPSVSERIVKGEIAAGVWLGGIALVFGMLNSTSMTP
jgi:putative membrane protein